MRKAFDSMLDDLNLKKNSMGKSRTLYSLRHMYATFRLSEEVSPFLLARQMGTSVEMLEQHYGQVVNRLVATQITKTRSRQTVKVTENVYPFYKSIQDNELREGKRRDVSTTGVSNSLGDICRIGNRSGNDIIRNSQ